MSVQKHSLATWSKKRSAFAVVAGLVVTFVIVTILLVTMVTALPGLYPNFYGDSPDVQATVGGRLLNISAMIVASIGGGYLGALVARRAPVNHGLVVGVFAMFGSFVGGSSTFASQTIWYTVLLSFALLLGGAVGGRLRGIQQARGLRKGGEA